MNSSYPQLEIIFKDLEQLLCQIWVELPKDLIAECYRPAVHEKSS